jgi:aldehyde:ferredoxin oxidoreductase
MRYDHLSEVGSNHVIAERQVHTMSSKLEDWEAQQEAKHAAAHKEGPLSFLAGGGAVASKREQEERRVSDILAHEAEERHKKLVEASMKGLRDATFPDEIAHFRDTLLKLNLTPKEGEELKKLLWEKFR